MDTLPFATTVALSAMSNEVHSALPDAPVVPYVEPAPRRPWTLRSRLAVASVLSRAADAVAPPECTPAR